MKNSKIIFNKETIKELNNIQDEFYYADVIVEKTSSLEKQLIKPGDVPENSIKWNDGNNLVNLVGLTIDNKMWAISAPTKISKGYHPSDFYSSTAVVENLVEKSMKFTQSLTEKIKFGIFVALIIVEIIILFLIFSTGLNV